MVYDFSGADCGFSPSRNNIKIVILLFTGMGCISALILPTVPPSHGPGMVGPQKPSLVSSRKGDTAIDEGRSEIHSLSFRNMRSLEDNTPVAYRCDVSFTSRFVRERQNIPPNQPLACSIRPIGR